MMGRSKFLKYLFLTIYISSFVRGLASENCQDRRKLCMTLCCEKWKSFNLNSKRCESLDKAANISWMKRMPLGRNYVRTISVLDDFDHKVETPCSAPLEVIDNEPNTLNLDHIFGDYCFTPHRLELGGKYTLLPLPKQCIAVKEETNVQENEVEALKNAYLIPYFTATILSTLLMLATILVYGTLKELREKINSKLFICYGISMMIPSILMMPAVYDYHYPYLEQYEKDIISKTMFYFGISSLQWSNVTCFEMRRTFRQINTERNWKKDLKRFLWYSLYVWSISFILTMVAWRFSLRNMHEVLLVPYITVNTIVFVILIVDVLRTRLKVAKLKEEKHSVWQILPTILRIFAMMGLSQITHYSVVLVTFLNDTSIIKIIMIFTVISTLDALLIFILFVMKAEVRSVLKTRICCCRKQYKKDPQTNTMSL
ncbi:G-protein coupled receptor Mth2-like [Stomoxys calcitrans]|uniref:G-protein coupled receptor Mth2-like n=1 Tax=Stomoxys calcitrans TaxID=35570 RepID=UPI0027E24B89|nr:G-protein coupled receptor Mth2-like [Stomoxys calcitrans]